MVRATSNFSNSMQVGQGGYGKVYRGTLVDGTPVAIKRAQEGSLQGSKEFSTEIELLSRFAISICNARYRRYIPVHQVTDMRTARYRAVPPKIDRRRSILAVGSRLKKKSTVGGRLREKSTVGGRLRKKKGRRRGKE
ncbi:hypothetical protein BHE74_00015291 [Ensete ventricosum]|nr:hypothetical protein BHE74_00015291 [Ensete ventricosum]RZS18904.1 hypothetical protein BHM03_00051229 [Ensete ventricosum]